MREANGGRVPSAPAAAASGPRRAEAAALPSGVPQGTVRPILLYPDPVLTARAMPAGELKFAPLRELVADLFETMYAANGRGLAAPQIGVSRRVFVMDEGWKRGDPAPLAFIEPQMVHASRKRARGVEECLSIPGRPVEVSRHAAIRVTSFDLSGIALERVLEGTGARIAQHELDHLAGILIVDPRAGVAPPTVPRARVARRGAAAGT